MSSRHYPASEPISETSGKEESTLRRRIEPMRSRTSAAYGISSSHWPKKVQAGTATVEEQEQYKALQTQYRKAYNEAVNNGYIDNSDFSETSSWESVNAQSNNWGDFGSGASYAYANHPDEMPEKAWYYVFNGPNGNVTHSSGAGNKQFIAMSRGEFRPEDYPGFWKEDIVKDGDLKRYWPNYQDYKDYDRSKWNDSTTMAQDVGDGVYVEHGGADSWFAIRNGKFYKLGTATTGGKAKNGLYNSENISGSGYDPSGIANWHEVGNNFKASGDLDFSGGRVVVNELGTEAIITPQGTITSLPSHTGIIPADVTASLWALGEVAPSIIRALTTHIAPDTIGKSVVVSSTDESFNVNEIHMNVTAGDNFDADAFVESIRTRVSLTKNTNR